MENMLFLKWNSTSLAYKATTGQILFIYYVSTSHDIYDNLEKREYMFGVVFVSNIMYELGYIRT
jgi:hypothetical protein